MMATLAADSRSTGPVASPEVARAVIDPKSYAAWSPLLDLFDTIRSQTPVLRIEAADDSFEPFWLVTRYDDVMRISKDNAGFLNAPRPTVLTSKAGEALPARSPAAAQTSSTRWSRSTRQSTPSCAA